MSRIDVEFAHLAGLRCAVFARLTHAGRVLASNPAFAQQLGAKASEADWEAGAYFLAPTLAELRERAASGRSVLHQGLLHVGPPGEVGRSLRGIVLAEGAELVVVAESDEAAYEEVARQVVALNEELGELHREQARTIAKLQRTEVELREALAQVRTLRGMLPICAQCKKIKNDEGYWERLETYIERHSEAELSHGLCQGCLQASIRELEAADEPTGTPK